MFDVSKFEAPQNRSLPVILLLDVSGSMSGDKIKKLHEAVLDMINCFVDQSKKETYIKVAIFTFGRETNLHTPYTDAKELNANGIGEFTADGGTPLGHILNMAKGLIEDKEETLGSDYTPSVVLVSDGAPNDHWEEPLRNFINDGRSAKTQRIAVAIGSDADKDMLSKFTCDPSLVFYAEDAGDIVDIFKKVTMSVSLRTRAKDHDSIPTNGANFDGSVKSPSVKKVSAVKVSSNDDDDDDDLDI